MRQSVFEPLQTELVSIDSMIPIGRGQRELIGILFLIKSIKRYLLCAYTAIALSEFFVIVRQLPIFLMLDGLASS
jgi:flagellar biosynthesis/type III secretory pathway ATPase